jgi:cell division protein FtsB
MPGPRPNSRPGAGPGRGRPRARVQTGRSPAPEPAAAGQTQNAAAQAPADRPAIKPTDPNVARRTGPPRLRANVTGRAIALVVVLLILVISYASSLRVYFAQSQEIAASKAEIAERQQRIAELQAERARWDNPVYVQTEARDRLGWVVPGEVGYRVVDADGKPLGGGQEIDNGTVSAPVTSTAWWTKLWNSVEKADRPAPVPRAHPARPPTVTVSTSPSPSGHR